MLDFCLDKGYRPVIMLLPVTPELYRLLSPSFLAEYVMSPIKKANKKNAPVMDYLNDERFISHDLYINSWWFNAAGRRIFSTAVIQEIYDTNNR
jgi:hypothetical protein